MKKSLFISFLSLAVAFSLIAQTEPEKAPLTGKSPAKKSQTNPPSIQSSGAKGATTAKADKNAKPIDQSNFDTSVKPSDDFFLYANGGWIKRTEIPADQTRW